MFDFHNADLITAKISKINDRRAYDKSCLDLAYVARKLVFLPGSKRAVFRCVLNIAMKMQNHGDDRAHRGFIIQYPKYLNYNVDEALFESATCMWLESGGTYTFKDELRNLSLNSNERPFRRAMQFMDDCTRSVILENVFTTIAFEWTPSRQDGRTPPHELADMVKSYAIQANAACRDRPRIENVRTAQRRGPYRIQPIPHIPPFYGVESSRHTCFWGCPNALDRWVWLTKERRFAVRPCDRDWGDPNEAAVQAEWCQHERDDLHPSHPWNRRRLWLETRAEREKAGTTAVSYYLLPRDKLSEHLRDLVDENPRVEES